MSSGQDARSVRTKAQLIEAAIAVFGAAGYDGASTRALAKEAGANLAAIPYHFGGKRELYLAAAQVIADYARDRFAEVIELLDGSAAADPGRCLGEALAHLLEIVVENAEPHSWTSFLARCVYENDEAYALIHETAVAPLVDRLSLTAAMLADRDLDSEAIRLHISAIVTGIVSLRFLRGILFRSMMWEKMSDHAILQMKDIIRTFVFQISNNSQLISNN